MEDLFQPTAADGARSLGERHKRRYELLNDRRRAIFELERLARTIGTHPRWKAALAARPWLGARLETPCESTPHRCPHAVHMSSAELENELRRLYRGLVNLARLWAALEQNRVAEL